MHINILTTTNIIPSVLLNGSAQTMVLVRDSVYLLLQKLPTQFNNCPIYALEADLTARGINKQHLPETLKLINYAELVDLICDHQTNATW